MPKSASISARSPQSASYNEVRTRLGLFIGDSLVDIDEPTTLSMTAVSSFVRHESVSCSYAPVKFLKKFRRRLSCTVRTFESLGLSRLAVLAATGKASSNAFRDFMGLLMM